MARTIYKVWCEENGDTREDGTIFHAYSHEVAALEFAQKYDSDGNCYLGHGGTLDVLVAEEGSDIMFRYTLSGEPTIQYYARELRIETDDKQ